MGNSQTLNVAISGNDTETKVEFVLRARTTGPADTAQAESDAVAEAAEEQASTTTPPTTTATPAAGNRLLSSVAARLLISTADAEDPNHYGCFARVKNANNKLVGQLTGSCAQVSSSSGTVKAGSKPKLCIPKIATRKVFDQYTVGTLIQESAGSYSLNADVENVVDDGANVCGNVPVNTMFCAAAVATNAAGASADVGSGSCPYMKKAAEKVQTAAAFAPKMDSTVTLAPSGSATIAPVTTPPPTTTPPPGAKVQTKIASKVGMQMTLPADATSESLMANDAFKTALQKAFASAVSSATGVVVEENAISIDAIVIAGSRRRRLEVEGRMRMLTTADKNLEVGGGGDGGPPRRSCVGEGMLVWVEAKIWCCS